METNQLYMAEQYIRASFINKGFFPEFIVTQNSMLRILDAMSNRLFDRELARELFNQCHISFKGDIQIENFIQVLLEANRLLGDKIIGSNKAIQDYSQQRNECVYQVKLAQQNSTTQIAPKLIITVIEATHLFRGNSDVSNKPYVVVFCGSEKRTTNLAQNDKYNPKFQQTFTFELQTGQEKTYASVVALDPNNQTQLLGEAHFSLDELKDQFKRNQNFNLYGRRGEQTTGQLRLELQYLTDQVQYYQQTLQNIDNYILDLQAEKTQYQQDVQQIYEPFSRNNLQKPQTNILVDAPALMFVNELSKPIIYKNDKKVDILRFKNPLLTDVEVTNLLDQHMDSYRMVNTSDKYAAKEDLLQKVNYGLLNPTREIYICALVITLYFVASLFLCFLKQDLINITLSLLCFLIISLNYFEQTSINLASLLLLLSIAFDFIWLVLYQDIFLEEASTRSEKPLKRIMHRTIVLLYITQVIKILLSISLFRIKPIAQYLNSKNQFGLGSYLYNIEAGSVNPLISFLNH